MIRFLFRTVHASCIALIIFFIALGVLTAIPLIAGAFTAGVPLAIPTGWLGVIFAFWLMGLLVSHVISPDSEM